MASKERRQTGGHYTSERDILKVINALFMDALRAEFEKARHSKAMLRQFHERLGKLRFFDPACGCGNFLVITYRELRLLEIEVLKALLGKEVQQELDVQALSKVDVDAYTGDLDYVTCWRYRAAEYIQGTAIAVGFVSTNSITQGEQVPLIWGLLFGKWRVKIHFAYRTFQWQSEARGKAHVHVVIIGFAAFDIPVKRLFDDDSGNGTATVTETVNIGPYLTPGPDTFVTKRQKPLSPVPEMRCGNKPSDGGNLILSDDERDALLNAEPGAGKYLRRFTGSEEFINGTMRWCLWLEGTDPQSLRVEFLFSLYEHDTAPLLPTEPAKKRRGLRSGMR